MRSNLLLGSNKSIYVFLSLLLGCLFSLSFDPYNIPFFALLIIGLFFKLNDSLFRAFGKDYKFFFITGFFFGFGFFITSIYWITNSIIVYDSNLSYLIPFPLIFLPMVLGIFYGMMQILNIIIWSKDVSRIFYFSAFWSFSEIVRSTILTGFPWNLIAYSWSWSIDFMQSLSLFGVFGLGVITVLCTAGIFSFQFKSVNIFISIFSILTFFCLYLFGQNRIINYVNTYADSTEIRLISTNFSQEEKWNSKSVEAMISLASDNLITVFPETSFGAQNINHNNWFGGIITKKERKFYNSIIYNGQQYDKRKLVPFGEFIPFNNFGLKNFLPIKSFSKGAKNDNFSEYFVPLICYEGVFPHLTRENIQEHSRLIVNITNDAWFGEGIGPEQHFTHVRFRTVEYGLPLVRSANMGISALVNPVGEVISLIPSGTLSYKDIKIPDKINNTIYRSFGDKIAYFLIVLFFFIGYSTSKFFKD
jgi:apolipoprotein N-acyltransferase